MTQARGGSQNPTSKRFSHLKKGAIIFRRRPRAGCSSKRFFIDWGALPPSPYALPLKKYCAKCAKRGIFRTGYADRALTLGLRGLRATAWIVLDVLLRATAWSALIALTARAAWISVLRKPRNLLFAHIKTEYGKKSHWRAIPYARLFFEY